MTYFKTILKSGISDKVATKYSCEAIIDIPSLYIDGKDATGSTYELQPCDRKPIFLEFMGYLKDSQDKYFAEFYFGATGQVALDNDGRIHFLVDNHFKKDGYQVEGPRPGGNIDSHNKFTEDNIDSALARTKLSGDFIADYLETNTFKEG